MKLARRRVALLTLLTSLALAGCRHSADALDASPAPTASPASSLPILSPPSPPPPPTPAGKAMMSYATAYASPARSSRVRTAARTLASLSRVTDTAGPPVSIVVSPAADHVGASYATGYDLWTAQGASTHRERVGDPATLTMLDGAFAANGSVMDYGGRSQPMTLREGNVQWALEVGDQWTSAVFLLKSMVVPVAVPLDGGGAGRAWDQVGARVRVTSERFFLPQRLTTRLVWSEDLDGAGCGAIADDRRIAVAMRAGRFLVFDGNNATPEMKGVRLADAPITFAAYDLSVVEGGFAALSVGSPMPASAPPLSPLGATLARAARRVEGLSGPPPRFHTVVHFLDPQGRVTAETEVPFEVLEPPIDGGGGRVYLFGNGVAAFDRGRMLYAQPSPLPMQATAFDDGSLALAIGHELRFLSRDGVVRQSFFTAAGETISTPPAIGADGSVWVGTERALYVAR